MENSQEKAMGTPSDTPQPENASPARAAAVGRRRLIKAGAAAVPVAATLVSRPAFAWHGKTPSAWGSEQLNPNTSLAAVHTAYVDEVWTIANWANNSGRAGLSNTWNALAQAYPAIRTSRNTINGVFDYQKVLFSELCAAVPLLRAPSGVPASTKVASGLASNSGSFQAIVVVAQLNHILLSSRIPDLNRIVSLQALQQMAAGTFKPNTSGQQAVWSQGTTIQYLQQNYLAV
jgi:hypothetical protein